MDEDKGSRNNTCCITYPTSYSPYGLSWSFQSPHRFATSSFIQNDHNQIQVFRLDPETQTIESTASIKHLLYPPTKILFAPSSSGKDDERNSTTDRLASTGDVLRLWKIDSDVDSAMTLEALFSTSSSTTGSCESSTSTTTTSAPLTSADWNVLSPNLIGTSSVDTTCTIWDINHNTSSPKTQLIAHDAEVYDLAFNPAHAHTFASVGAEGSLRVFDLRSLDSSTILYETSTVANVRRHKQLLRLAWNPFDANIIATIQASSPTVILIDVRVPSIPVAEITHDMTAKHVHAMAWSPDTPNCLCTVGDDRQARVWNTATATSSMKMKRTDHLARVSDHVDSDAQINSPSDIHNVQWSRLSSTLALACDTGIHIQGVPTPPRVVS